MKIFAIVLYVISIVIGISVSAKVVPAGEMPDNLMLFFVGVIGAIIGLILWHRSNREEVKEMLENAKEEDNPLVHLAKVKEQINHLQVEGDYLAAVDSISEGPIFHFIEESRKLLDIFGQEQGAQIILSFAQVERALNRSWSAFSDGHIEEANRSLQHAKELIGNLEVPTV